MPILSLDVIAVSEALWSCILSWQKALLWIGRRDPTIQMYCWCRWYDICTFRYIVSSSVLFACVFSLHQIITYALLYRSFGNASCCGFYRKYLQLQGNMEILLSVTWIVHKWELILLIFGFHVLRPLSHFVYIVNPHLQQFKHVDKHINIIIYL